MLLRGCRHRSRTWGLVIPLVLAGLWSGLVGSTFSLCRQPGSLTLKPPLDLCCLDETSRVEECCLEMRAGGCRGCTDQPLLSLLGISSRSPESPRSSLAVLALSPEPLTCPGPIRPVDSGGLADRSTGPPRDGPAPLRC